VRVLTLVALMLASLPWAARANDRAPWSLEEMNQTLDETNFIVGRGCSGTLISLEYRLVLTAHHCIERYVSIVTRKDRAPDGTVKEIERERLRRVTVSQKDYDGHSQVGALSYETDIIARVKDRDLALLQLVADNLRSSVAAQVLPEDAHIYRGESVTAVGNPRGLDTSVTRGIVSSVNRAWEVSWANGEEVPLIQFDAAAAPGSSGGALYDSAGYLIGVTVAGSRGEFALAIPVSEVRDLLDANCMASVHDAEADDEACRAEKEEAEEGEEG